MVRIGSKCYVLGPLSDYPFGIVVHRRYFTEKYRLKTQFFILNCKTCPFEMRVFDSKKSSKRCLQND